MSKVNWDTEFISKDLLKTVCQDITKSFDELRLAINTHAEVLNIHRYILEKFVPAPLLSQALAEYDKLRRAEIDKAAQEAASVISPPQAAN